MANLFEPAVPDKGSDKDVSEDDNSGHEVIESIKRRYLHERSIYTWCGVALVAVNPYQEQDIYGQQVVETYHSASHSVYLQLDPHVYAVTEDAYSKLELHSKNQSIIVSGESGAGKTVSAKHAMQYLASIAHSNKNKNTALKHIEQRVLASNPLMEAIGNARTVRNENSSRFGKYIMIYFDRHQRRIIGANMRTYLLEKSRVTKQQAGERNFHIFYQLLNFAQRYPEKMAHLRLLDSNSQARDFKYLMSGNCEPGLTSSSASPASTSRDDLRRFNEALCTLGIDKQRIQLIYRIIAGILHGGNIEFKVVKADEYAQDDDCGCDIDMKNDSHFQNCCELIGLDPEELSKRLCFKILRSGQHDIIEKPQSKQKAEYSRDAMLKFIYECLFTWLVALINVSLDSRDTSAEQVVSDTKPSVSVSTPKSPSAKKSILQNLQQQEPQFIGVLDIYGFENFQTNSFEQFCINYANEVLQQQYNQHVFKIEQEEYIREGIDWTFIGYSDNQAVIELIESRPIGILNLLDEECKMPKGTDESWCAKLYDQLLEGASAKKTDTSKAKVNDKDRVPFKKPKLNYRNCFTICHYAEDVNYNVETFLEKNRDSLAEEQCQMLRSSEVLSFIFEDPNLSLADRPRMRTSRSSTVGWQFRGSLAALIKTLNNTEPHYIRCIKPNDEKRAFEFNEKRAMEQLRACGVYETIRISNNGFPARWSYKDFAKRYCVLIYGTSAYDQLKVQSLANEVRPICEAICRLAYDELSSPYKRLRTTAEQDYIDLLIERHGNKPSAIYQFGKSKLFFRAGQLSYLERIRGQRLREHSVTIQRHVRGWLARKMFVRRREEYYEQLRQEAHLASLQEQARLEAAEREASAAAAAAREAAERELVELERIDQQEDSLANQMSSEQSSSAEASSITNGRPEMFVSSLASVYYMLVDMMYATIQPLIISALLEYEALDQPEPFMSLESQCSSRSQSPEQQFNEQSMDNLIKELDKFHDLTKKNCVPEEISVQAFKQIFYLICAHSLNQLLIRRDLCQFRKAMQINFNLSCLVQWCRERYLVKWKEIVEQLDPITQATKLLQTRKSSSDIATIEEVCNKLRPSQIIKILNLYSSSYEEQITTDFIHELEEYLNCVRSQIEQQGDENNNGFNKNINNSNNFNQVGLLMDTKLVFSFDESQRY